MSAKKNFHARTGPEETSRIRLLVAKVIMISTRVLLEFTRYTQSSCSSPDNVLLFSLLLLLTASETFPSRESHLFFLPAHAGYRPCLIEVFARSRLDRAQ